MYSVKRVDNGRPAFLGSASIYKVIWNPARRSFLSSSIVRSWQKGCSNRSASRDPRGFTSRRMGREILRSIRMTRRDAVNAAVLSKPSTGHARFSLDSARQTKVAGGVSATPLTGFSSTSGRASSSRMIVSRRMTFSPIAASYLISIRKILKSCRFAAITTEIRKRLRPAMA